MEIGIVLQIGNQCLNCVRSLLYNINLASTFRLGSELQWEISDSYRSDYYKSLLHFCLIV